MQHKGLLQRLHSHFSWWKYTQLDRRMGHGHPESVEQWDSDYASGQWAKLSSLTEAGRNGVMAAYITKLKPLPRVLDLGCGTGELLYFLAPASLQCYHGIDLSQEAVKQARFRWAFPNVLFEQQAIETFSSLHRFDVIILNEVLYYLSDPLVMLHRLSLLLADNGVFLISMVEPSGHYIWPKLFDALQPIDSQQLTHASGITWNVGVFKSQ